MFIHHHHPNKNIKQVMKKSAIVIDMWNSQLPDMLVAIGFEKELDQFVELFVEHITAFVKCIKALNYTFENQTKRHPFIMRQMAIYSCCLY